MDMRIPPELARAVQERVQSGRYASPDEVFAACLEALEREEENVEELRAEIDEGIESAEREELIPGEEVVSRMIGKLLRGELQSFVQLKLDSGEYASSTEVFEAAIRALQEQEAEDEAALEELRAELQVGMDALNRGEWLPADEAFERIGRWREDDAA